MIPIRTCFRLDSLAAINVNAPTNATSLAGLPPKPPPLQMHIADVNIQ